MEVQNTLWKLIMYVIDKIAKRLLEDQNLMGRTSSWGLLVRKSSLLSKFVFLFLEHWNINYFTQEVSCVTLLQLIRACAVATPANAFLGSWARPYWLLLILFFYLKRLLKSSQKFLVCWDSWQDLNPSIVIKIMYSSESEPFIVYQRPPLP